MLRASHLIAVTAAAFLVAGCSPGWAFTQTGPAAPTRPTSCQVRLLTTAPDQPYVELGILDQDGHGDIRNAGDFLQSVRPHVCRAGGNAIVVRTSGTGQYMGGAVLNLQ